MNADGSSGVDADVSVGADVPIVDDLATGFTIGGFAGLGAGLRPDGRRPDQASAAAVSACRIGFGSMNRTSSRMTSNSSMSVVPSARK